MNRKLKHSLPLGLAIACSFYWWFFLATTFVAGGADVSYYLVGKGSAFNQTTSAGPVPKGNSARFLAQVVENLNNSVTNATVQFLPTGTTNALILGGNGSGNVMGTFSFQAKFPSQAAMDATDPNGNYQMVIHSVHDGMKTATLDLTGNSYPPSNPFITNPFDTGFGLVTVSNPAAPFSLTWSGFAGGTTRDFIQVTIANGFYNVVRTPDIGQSGALNGTATSLLIPANTFPGGSKLAATLVFAKAAMTNSTAYPGVPGFAAYYTETDFGLVTYAEDVSAYNIAKHQFFVQNDSGAPVPNSSPAFRFIAQVFANNPNLVTNSQLQLPSPGGSDVLNPDSTDTVFGFQHPFPNQTALDTAFAAGVYSFQLGTAHDGNRVLTLIVPVDSFPISPHIANWTALQNLNPLTRVGITWDTFSGATSVDDIILAVNDSTGNSPVFVQLPSTATGFNVPTGAFKAGQSYQGVLQFRHFVSVDTTNYPGATGSVRFVSRTFFNLSAAGNTAVPPSLAIVLTGLPPFQIQLTGQVGRAFAIDVTSNLQTGPWIPLLTNTALAGQFLFTDLQSSNFPVRFYRGRSAN